MSFRLWRSAFLLAAAFTFGVSSTQAQTVSGTVEGTVQDSQGGRLPGVNIQLRSTETGQLRTSVTNGEGFFQMPFVPIGRYRVSSELSGFGRKINEIEVRLNSSTVVNF